MSGYTVYAPANPLRGLQISIDDWEFSTRITALRKRFQRMLSVAGSIGVIAGIVFGADIRVLTYGLHESLGTSIGARTVSRLLHLRQCSLSKGTLKRGGKRRMR